MKSIPKELFELIKNDLNFIDVISLKHSCKYLSTISVKSFSDIFEKNFYAFIELCGDNLQKNINNLENKIAKEKSKGKINGFNTSRLFRYKFCEEMHKNKGYITGNFILDCVLEKDRFHSTIPIFINDDNKDKFESYLQSCSFGKINEPTTMRDPDDINIIHELNYTYSALLCCNGYSLQRKLSLISTEKNIAHNIKFDGRKLYVKDWNKILYGNSKNMLDKTIHIRIVIILFQILVIIFLTLILLWRV